MLAVYLPAELSEGDLAALVEAAVAESGATAPGQMGLVMKVLTPKVMEAVGKRAIQLHGALGTTYDLPLTRMFASGLMLALADGPTEVHSTTVARQLLRQYKPVDGLWPSEHIPTLRAAAERELLGVPTGAGA